MINILLQVWGGAFYLLNKLFFLFSERSANSKPQKVWRSWAWICYLIGLPPWVYIFISERNWIAASVESSGLPSMLLGLSTALPGRNHIKGQRWLDHLSKLMIVFGLGLSVYDFGGLVSLNQFLESGIAVGFLIGTYYLAKSKPQGYFWLALGNICAAYLMMRQEYFVLVVQQAISLCLVIAAFRVQTQKLKRHHQKTVPIHQ